MEEDQSTRYTGEIRMHGQRAREYLRHGAGSLQTGIAATEQARLGPVRGKCDSDGDERSSYYQSNTGTMWRREMWGLVFPFAFGRKQSPHNE